MRIAGQGLLFHMAHCSDKVQSILMRFVIVLTIVKATNTLLGKVLSGLRVYPKSDADDVVKNDPVLIWSGEKRVVTGSGILERLPRGIASRDIVPS